jgi:hypothetical protein
VNTPSYEVVASARMSHETAKIYNAELERLKIKHGKLTDELIVQEARHPSSPLHNWFNFDDVSAAAMAHWVGEARELVRCVHLMVITVTMPRKKPVKARNAPHYRAWVKTDGSYDKVTSIPSSGSRALELLQQCRADIASASKRLGALKTIFSDKATMEAINSAQKTIDRASAQVGKMHDTLAARDARGITPNSASSHLSER